DPPQHRRLVAVEVKDGVGRRAVQEVNPAVRAAPFQAETADPVAREAGQVVLPAAERVAAELDQLFVAAREVPSQAEQPLAVLAERVEADGHRPAVGPQDLVALVADLALVPVLGGIPPKEYRKRPYHPHSLYQVRKSEASAWGI